MNNKIESSVVFELICMYDVIFISEIKQKLSVKIPGYEAVEAKNEKYSRGGLIMFVKSSLFPSIKSIDNSVNEQIWFELEALPNYVFGGVYIPPSNSLFFREDAFPYIQQRTSDKEKYYVFGGDFNARCGDKVCELIKNDNEILNYRISDHAVNDNGKELVQICSDNHLLIVNGLETTGGYFPSDLKKKDFGYR